MFKPTEYFIKITDLSNEYFRQSAITAILIDIDNTLVVDGRYDISEENLRWLEGIELPLCLISNGKESRVKRIAELLDLPYVYKARKPLKHGFLRAANLLNESDCTKIAVIGDQLFSDILGGNLLKMKTFKVEPLDKKADPFTVKVKRWFEKFVRY